MQLYFRDNFFNAGRTDILSDTNMLVGEIDLRSTFGSALDLYDESGSLLYSGKFPVFSNMWSVLNASGKECGQLRQQLSFFSSRYEYDANGRGVYEITSPAFSREYEIRDEKGTESARFEKVSGWFIPSAYRLNNDSTQVDSFEWVAVVMGMHAIEQRRRKR